MRILLFLFLLFPLGWSHAQTWKTNADRADSLRRSGAHEASIPLYKKVLSEIPKSDVENQKIYNIRIGLSYFFDGKNDLAKSHYQWVLTATEFDTLNIWRGHAFNNLALLYDNSGANKRSIRNYQKARLIYLENNNELMADVSKMNIGKVYTKIGEYDLAIEMITEATEGFIKREEFIQLGEAYSSLGVIQEKFKNFNQAASYYRQSAQVRKRIDDHYGLASAYNNLGGALKEMGALDSAVFYYSKSLDLYANTSKRNIGTVRHNMGLVYEQQGRLQFAREQFKLALTAKREFKDSGEVAFTLNALASLEIQTRNYDQAYGYLNESRQILTELENPRILQENYVQWKEFYKATENLDSALYYLEQSTLLQQRINQKEYLEQVADLYMTFDVDQKESHIVSLVKSNGETLRSLRIANRRIDSLLGWMAFVGMLLVLLLGSFIIYRQRSKRKVLESKVAGIEQEKKRLSMELHEASGTQIRTILNELRKGNIDQQKTESIIKKTTMLGDEIRLISHSLHHPQLETSVFRLLLEDTVYDWQSEQGVQVELQIDDSEWLNQLPIEYRSHIYRFLQESLLNIQKHSTPINVRVNIKQLRDHFEFKVRNEADQEQQETRPGIGLENLRTRAKLMHGTYHFKRDEHSSESILQIPVNRN